MPAAPAVQILHREPGARLPQLGLRRLSFREGKNRKRHALRKASAFCSAAG